MTARTCKVCGCAFPARTNYKCCSDTCSKTNQRQRMKAWKTDHPERMTEIRRQFMPPRGITTPLKNNTHSIHNQ